MSPVDHTSCSLSWREVFPLNQEHINEVSRMYLPTSLDQDRGQLVSCLLSVSEGPYFIAFRESLELQVSLMLWTSLQPRRTHSLGGLTAQEDSLRASCSLLFAEMEPKFILQHFIAQIVDFLHKGNK